MKKTVLSEWQSFEGDVMAAASAKARAHAKLYFFSGAFALVQLLIQSLGPAGADLDAVRASLGDLDEETTRFIFSRAEADRLLSAPTSLN